MPKQQSVQDSRLIDKQIKAFLNENPEIKKSLKIFNVSDKEYVNALEAQNQKEQLIFTNSTGEAVSGHLRGNSN